MLRKILIAVAALIVILLAAGIYVIRMGVRGLARDERMTQQQLQPRVIKGAGQFKKQSFYTAAELGNISEILAGWPADREDATLAVVGNRGAHFLDQSGRPIKRVRFSRNIFCPVEISRLDASGDYGFLTREQSWSCPVILFDRQGQERWSYSAGLLSAVDDAVSFTIDGSITPNVVLGLNGGGGLVLLDGQGKRIWQKPEGNVWHVEALDTNADGQKEILHSDARGHLLVRNHSGDVIGRYLPGVYVSHFTVTRWGSDVQPSHILVPVNEGSEGANPELLVLDAGGKTLAHLEAPLENFMVDVKATPVRYGRNAEYYAVLSNKRASTPRSMLLLYAGGGQLAYQEIIGDDCRGIAALPGNSGERLLVGCIGNVFEYSPVDSSPQ